MRAGRRRRSGVRTRCSRGRASQCSSSNLAAVLSSSVPDRREEHGARRSEPCAEGRDRERPLPAVRKSTSARIAPADARCPWRNGMPARARELVRRLPYASGLIATDANATPVSRSSSATARGPARPTAFDGQPRGTHRTRSARPSARRPTPRSPDEQIGLDRGLPGHVERVVLPCEAGSAVAADASCGRELREPQPCVPRRLGEQRARPARLQGGGDAGAPSLRGWERSTAASNISTGSATRMTPRPRSHASRIAVSPPARRYARRSNAGRPRSGPRARRPRRACAPPAAHEPAADALDVAHRLHIRDDLVAVSGRPTRTCRRARGPPRCRRRG